MRRQWSVGCAATISILSRSYRVMPHLETEIEELAETQRPSRWFTQKRANYQHPMTNCEIMAERLGTREKYRNQVLPEKANARRLSQTYAQNGIICTPTYKSKLIHITVVGFEGHPFHFRVHPMADVTLNTLIDGSGMMQGNTDRWTKCMNVECQDKTHGEGCLVNVDLETLDRLPPPTRYEYLTLLNLRIADRPEVKYHSRFSCQIPLVPELDGALFALKQFNARGFVETYTGWTRDDTFATIGAKAQRKIEPFAPYIEENTKNNVVLNWDLFWAQSYQDLVQAHKPHQVRRDGLHSRPETWSFYT